MALISVTPLVNGQLDASSINDIVTEIVDEVNGNLSDVNIASNADINGSKILDGSITSRKFKPTAGVVRATGNVNLSTSYQDITGATVNITCDIASTILVTGFFDIQGVKSTSNVCHGALSVDSTVQTGTATIDTDTTAAIRGTVGQAWSVNVAAGVHTVKLQAKTTADAGTEQCNTDNTCFLYEVISQ